MREIDAQGTPPSEAQMSLMRTLQARTRMHGQISVGLMLIAIICMVASKYV
jgi:hypothetical protein